MKILHIETGRHLYGGALQVCYLLEGLAGSKYENLLVCCKGSEISLKATAYSHVIPIKMFGDFDLFFPFRIAKLIKEHRPDVVHVHSRRGADTFLGFCARLMGIPAIVTRRVDNPEWGWWARLKYGSYTKVVAISEGIRDVLLKEGVLAEHVVCVRSVIDIEKFRYARDRDWFGNEFNVHSDAPVIGVVAQLINRKGHCFLLNIVNKLLVDFPTLRVFFFGKGPLFEEFEKRIESLELGHVVTLAGFRDDMAKVLPCLDLLVHPALSEGLGVSLIQAAASRVPIVASKVGGIPEIVVDGYNGVLVEPGDSEGLYKSIYRILESQSIRESMGENGFNIVKQLFTMSSMIDSYKKLYNGL